MSPLIDPPGAVVSVSEFAWTPRSTGLIFLSCLSAFLVRSWSTGATSPDHNPDHNPDPNPDHNPDHNPDPDPSLSSSPSLALALTQALARTLPRSTGATSPDPNPSPNLTNPNSDPTLLLPLPQVNWSGFLVIGACSALTHQYSMLGAHPPGALLTIPCSALTHQVRTMALPWLYLPFPYLPLLCLLWLYLLHPVYFMPPGARPAQGKRGGTGRLVYLRAGLPGEVAARCGPRGVRDPRVHLHQPARAGAAEAAGEAAGPVALAPAPRRNPTCLRIQNPQHARHLALFPQRDALFPVAFLYLFIYQVRYREFM
eukprot:scaffold62443_cov55-Phaeocystis_antarctica.AAC.1